MKKILEYLIVGLVAILAFLLGVDCVKNHKAKDKKNEWHFLVPHNRGTEQEDSNGCPCACIMLGWSSYANMTNATAHGFYSLYEEVQKRSQFTNGVIRLSSIYDLEKAIIAEINAKEGKAK